MAKYPVEISDKEGTNDAINYLLAGPSGLGQNFAGFSSTADPESDPPVNILAYLTGNYRPPFTQATPALTYVAPIALSTAEYLDDRTIKYTFAAAEPTPPFALGNPLEVVGVTPSGPYDGVQKPTGVLECSTTYVIVRINGDGTVYPPGTGGTIAYNAFGGLAFVSTDCNAKATVNSPTDRVFVSAQLGSVLSYECSATSSFSYNVMINRRKAFPDNKPINPDFIWVYDSTIATKNYYFQVDPGTGTIPPPFPAGDYRIGTEPIDTIFTAVIDQPDIGYYWYLIEVEIEVLGGDVVITQNELSNRSLSAQVVKQ